MRSKRERDNAGLYCIGEETKRKKIKDVCSEIQLRETI